MDKKKYTYEECQIEALKYSKRTDFRKKSRKFYDRANEENWLNSICGHMKIVDGKYKRLIYAYEFPEKENELLKAVYVGLTCNPETRNEGHLISKDLRKKSSVYKYYKKTGLIPTLKIVTDYMSEEEAQTMEGKILEEYKKNGWRILNKNKTGGLGSCKRKIYTIEMCIEKAKSCKTRSEFYSSSLYHVAIKNDWMKNIKNYLPDKIRRVNYKNNNISDKKTWEKMAVTVDDWENQIILGSLLGSAFIIEPKKGVHAYLSIRQSKTLDKNIFLYKVAELKAFSRENSIYEDKYDWKWNSISHREFNFAKEMCYKDNKKCVTSEWLNSLKDVALMVWYLEKGFYEDGIIGLNISNLNEKELIIEYFNKIGIPCDFYLNSNKKIAFSEEGTKIFLSIIGYRTPLPLIYKLKEQI